MVGNTEIERERVKPYEVVIRSHSSGIILVPSSLVDNSGFYRPSQEVEKQVGDMWSFRRPRAIGSTSEMIAVEILHRARINVDGATMLLTCEKLRNVVEVSAGWKPQTGIYCDDLIAITEDNRGKLLLLTEVKGTTLRLGLSHSSEAKMFYQLARTYAALVGQGVSSEASFRIRGVITIVIAHFQRTITLNALNEETAIGFFPDGWLPGGVWS
jgi:hypothetical protein